MKNRFQSRLYEILEPGAYSAASDMVFDRAILALIVINVVAVILESFGDVATGFVQPLRITEAVSVIIFTVEYGGRIYVSPIKYPAERTGKAVLRYLLSSMALIDLAAILPFYLPLVMSIDLRFLRILRLARLLRVLKLSRYTDALNLIARVLKRKANQLIVTLFVTSLLLLLSASAMYYVETETQPEAFPNIIAAFWWAVATLTTVGYGDVYPITAMGRVLAGTTALLGIGIVALPTGIISAGFLEEIERKDETGRRKSISRSSSKTKQRRRQAVLRRARRRHS